MTNPKQADNDNNKEEKFIVPTEPPIGSYAYTARMMAEICPDFDWDAWKDEMKERDDF